MRKVKEELTAGRYSQELLRSLELRYSPHVSGSTYAAGLEAVEETHWVAGGGTLGRDGGFFAHVSCTADTVGAVTIWNYGSCCAAGCHCSLEEVVGDEASEGGEAS